jgi:hypothetical protein
MKQQPMGIMEATSSTFTFDLLHATRKPSRSHPSKHAAHEVFAVYLDVPVTHASLLDQKIPSVVFPSASPSGDRCSAAIPHIEWTHVVLRIYPAMHKLPSQLTILVSSDIAENCFIDLVECARDGDATDLLEKYSRSNSAREAGGSDEILPQKSTLHRECSEGREALFRMAAGDSAAIPKQQLLSNCLECTVRKLFFVCDQTERSDAGGVNHHLLTGSTSFCLSMSEVELRSSTTRHIVVQPWFVHGHARGEILLEWTVSL